ncbi:MAG: PRC-barrel domain-containing protein, partial [Propionibacteriaceae bacterium]|nr:PRC-barrel domain-containing protein [Propionibacteriaceae bacterium]
MTHATSIFISRLRGLPVVDSGGDQIGKVRDVVIQVRAQGRAPRAKGLVVELFARQRIFVNTARVFSVDAMQVVISGTINTRRFSRHDAETLVIDDLFDRRVQRSGSAEQWTVYDISMREVRNREWELSEVALAEVRNRGFRRKPHVTIVDWSEVDVLRPAQVQAHDQVVAELEEMHAADVARELHDMDPTRRAQVVQALDDAKLADALEELPEEEQIQVI